MESGFSSAIQTTNKSYIPIANLVSEGHLMCAFVYTEIV